MPAIERPLISVVELDSLLGSVDSAPAVLDIRWELGGRPGRESYDEGHIPGAAFVDLEAVLAAPPGPGGRHPLPDAAVFEAGMRTAGVSDERPVVVYDAATAMAAARGWWLLRYFGHTRVAVLDGGLGAWVDAGLPVEAHAAAIDPGDFTARPGGMPLLDADGAAELAARGVLLDARAPERFAGEREPIDLVAGHIPGARNRPSAMNVAADGRFKPADALGAAFAELGIVPGVEAGAYCGSGVVAAHEVLALALAGHQAALYVGSWSDWITDPRRPVQTGRLA